MKNSFPILIVEDDPVTREMLKKILTEDNHEVVAISNGREALEILKETFFPILITDWMMPEVDGLELCRAIRKQKFASYTYIIMLTSKEEKNDTVSGLDAGADDFLIKPFDKAVLLARLRAGFRILELEKSLSETYQKIKTLSITDSLTGCYNRGYLMKHLSREIKRCTRYGKPLHIVMSDIDSFKGVNDTYGHQVGDLVLREFAGCITNNIRDGVDWLARYGGEEFVLVLPEINLEGAWKVSEKIRLLVSEMVISANGEKLKTTASFGIAGFENYRHGKRVSIETLIKQADENLYRAKEGGRNRTVGEKAKKQRSTTPIKPIIKVISPYPVSI